MRRKTSIARDDRLCPAGLVPGCLGLDAHACFGETDPTELEHDA